MISPSAFYVCASIIATRVCVVTSAILRSVLILGPGFTFWDLEFLRVVDVTNARLSPACEF